MAFEYKTDFPHLLRKANDRCAIATRFVEDIPTENLQLECMAKLENEFYRLQSEFDCMGQSQYNTRTLLEAIVAALESSVKDLQIKDSALYYGLSRTHPEYQKFLRFQSLLESEFITWKIIFELLVHRGSTAWQEHELQGSDQNADTEKNLVDEWMKSPQLSAIKVVLDVLEDTYSRCNPPELLLPGLKVRAMAPRLHTTQNAKHARSQSRRLRDMLPSTSVTDEEIYEAIFKSIRAGNFECAETIAKSGGIGVFNVNYRLRDYLTEPVVGGNHSRLQWKNWAWNVSQDMEIGPWQRATWGILCGNYAATLPVACSWEDRLWIYLTCFLDLCIESMLCRTVSGIVQPNTELASILPVEYWSSGSGLEISKIFDKLQSPDMNSSGSCSVPIFINSIRAAVTNDLEPSLLIYEDFILNMAKNKLPMDGMQVFDVVRQASQSRFVVFVLSLVKDAGIPMDRVFYGRACFLYAQAAVERNVQMLAFYVSRIPEPELGEAVKSFVSAYESPKDLSEFFSSILMLNRQSSMDAGKAFLAERFLSLQISPTPEIREGFNQIFKVFCGVPEIAATVLACLNRLVRLLLLKESPDASLAYSLVYGLKSDIGIVMGNLDAAGELDNVTEDAKSETFCWLTYFEICRKCDEYNRYHLNESLEDVDNPENLLEGTWFGTVSGFLGNYEGRISSVRC
ncbi:nuclear pore complex protein Nup107-like isoform X2 [Paramacrobiotus metropolitanus]|uniref:nuclear pore complex protein Nup107-like isoform X2 n=1 Tax=Paramacrobiotus metropolitanus TaxID=2943436 RepID=UPI0024456702|nr:nuclear pore complex protein Nup107-like isoform X2 [Paramacrobiotus metropolitanus]